MAKAHIHLSMTIKGCTSFWITMDLIWCVYDFEAMISYGSLRQKVGRFVTSSFCFSFAQGLGKVKCGGIW